MMLVDRPPSGDDGATVRQYYDHLYSTYLDRLDQTYLVRPVTAVWVGLFIVVLVGAIAIIAAAQKSSTRSAGGPTPLETYDGYISEGNGSVGIPLMVAFAGIGLWCVALTALHLLQGQVY